MFARVTLEQSEFGSVAPEQLCVNCLAVEEALTGCAALLGEVCVDAQPGLPAPEVDEGNAFVYLGNSSGIAVAPDITLDDPADQSGGNFGISVASAGDTNGDGYADVIVGAFLQDSPAINEGNAFVYFGGSAGVMGAPGITLDNPADQLQGLFGISVTSAGDTNGDGYADVIVGAHLQDASSTDEGNAFAYLDGSFGSMPAPDTTLDNPTNQWNAHFGFSVASADRAWPSSGGWSSLVAASILTRSLIGPLARFVAVNRPSGEILAEMRRRLAAPFVSAKFTVGW